MALIQCSVCNKRISDKSITCASCGAPVNSKDAEATERAERNLRWKRNKRIQNYSFLTLLTFLIGAFLFWAHRDEIHSWSYYIGVFLLSTGFIGYSVLRIYKMLKK